MVSLSTNTNHQDRIVKQMRENGQRVEIVDLVCVTDGRKVPFLDDGPWQHLSGLPMGDHTPHNPGRQRLLIAVKERDRDNNPLWFSEKPGVRVFDFAINEYRDVPCTSEPRFAQLAAAHKVIRDERMVEGQRRGAQLRKEAEAESKANAEAAAVGALARLINRATGDDKPTKTAKDTKGGAA